MDAVPDPTSAFENAIMQVSLVIMRDFMAMTFLEWQPLVNNHEVEVEPTRAANLK